MTDPTPDPGDLDWTAFARGVRQRRTQLGLSQKEVAERAGVRTNTISRIETAAAKAPPEMTTIAAVSSAVGWDLVDVAQTLLPSEPGLENQPAVAGPELPDDLVIPGGLLRKIQESTAGLAERIAEETVQAIRERFDYVQRERRKDVTDDAHYLVIQTSDDEKNKITHARVSLDLHAEPGWVDDEDMARITRILAQTAQSVFPMLVEQRAETPDGFVSTDDDRSQHQNRMAAEQRGPEEES